MEQSKFYQIKNITEQEYTLVDCDGSVITRPIRDIDKSASAFTIQDAKDGDVLCTYECDKPKIVFILKGTPKKHYALSYHCYYNIMYPHFASDSEKGCLAPNNEDVKPATKEQRDLLFKKMHEAGYEWDAEHKQLNKIEQKSATMSLDEAIEHCKEKSCGNNACALEHKQLEKWLTELKELKEQKHTWSEEDEEIYRKCICSMRASACGFPEEEKFVEQVDNWFKSLKDRVQHQNTWKPSDEQLTQLSNASNGLYYNCETLLSLLEQLNKLREE